MNNPHSQFQLGEDSLLNIENSLASILKPVSPNPDFVRQLGYRIANPPPITVERRAEMKAVAVIAFSLFSGVLLVWILITVSRFFSGGKSRSRAA